MNKDQLLKPRYKVIADYPQQYFLDPKTNPIKAGDVLEQYLPNSVIWRKSVNGVWTEDTVHYPDRFTAIFKPLQWWEEREEKDLPEYVKWARTELCGKIEKVNGVDMLWPSVKVNSQVNTIHCDYFVPATLEEYNQYNQQKSKS